jgi:hypothetical protein
MQDTSGLTVWSRLLWLLGGTVYLTILVALYSRLTGWPIVLAAVAILLVAATIIVVIAIFCAKWVRHDGRRGQTKLSTLFLPFIPISIYLALYSQLLKAIRKEAPGDMAIGPWITILPFAVFVAFTTIVLLGYGEALAWLLIHIRRLWVNHRITAESARNLNLATTDASDV